MALNYETEKLGNPFQYLSHVLHPSGLPEPEQQKSIVQNETTINLSYIHIPGNAGSHIQVDVIGQNKKIEQHLIFPEGELADTAFEQSLADGIAQRVHRALQQ